MSRRRRHHEEEENLERWLVSYADFVTLLFAFFVVMYAISSVNEGKYRVLSESLDAVFNESLRSIDPIQLGDPVRALTQEPAPLVEPRQQAGAGNGYDQQAELDAIERLLKVSLVDYLDQGLVEVARTDDQVEVRIKDKMLFDSGQAELSQDASAVLKDLAGALATLQQQVMVEGHTDNVPIRTRQFPSNWELSAARAASVVSFLAHMGVSPKRLAAVGYGEFRPIASNDAAQGRARNRRVAILLSPQKLVAEEDSKILRESLPWAEGPALDLR